MSKEKRGLLLGQLSAEGHEETTAAIEEDSAGAPVGDQHSTWGPPPGLARPGEVARNRHGRTQLRHKCYLPCG